MTEESKCPNKSEVGYKTEYALRKDIHYRIGEILKLEYENAKQLREIERLNTIIDEKEKSIGECLRRIDEHLQDKARLTIDLEHMIECIEVLESKLSTREEDPEAFIKIGEIAKEWNSMLQSDVDSYKMMAQIYSLTKDGSDAVEGTTVFKDFYLFARQLILKTYLDVNRCDVDLKYMKSAFRYMLPCLGDPRALLGDDEKCKIRLAENILHKFEIETMDKYGELIGRGDIDIQIVDRRTKVSRNLGPSGIITTTSPGNL